MTSKSKKKAADTSKSNGTDKQMSYWNNHRTEEQAMLGELIAIRQLLSIGFKKEIAEHEVEKAIAAAQWEVKDKEHKRKSVFFEKLFLEWGQEMNLKRARTASVSNLLARAEIYSMEDLDKYSDDDLLRIRNFGQKALKVTKAVKAWHVATFAEAAEAREVTK